MNIFLNFKNKNYEAIYNENIDSYLTGIIRSNMVVVIVGLPFLPLLQYLSFHFTTSPAPINIERTAVGALIYVLLILVSLFIWRARSHLRRHQKATRWVFDTFYILISGYLAYQFWDAGLYITDPVVRYFGGWWDCLIAVTLFNPISHWYMKLSAYLILILRIGINTYTITSRSNSFVNMFEMIILQVLLTYLSERDQRKYFIEKQNLFEETKVFREIFDETAEGVVIYGVKEGEMFTNWSTQKYRWWDSRSSLDQNLRKIALKGFKKTRELPLNMILNLDKLMQSANQLNVWDFFERFVEQLNPILSNRRNEEKLTTGSLLVLTGHTAEGCPNQSTFNGCILEIKIMYTIFKEKAALALIFSDITERTLVTTLQENNSYKDRLLASVSHELRTPLNASINFTLGALDHPELSNSNDVKENYLLPALRSNQLLLHLINDILDFSQMSANKLRLVYETLNVTNTLDECINLIKIQATKKGLKLLMNYEFENHKPDFCTDHNRLKQILLNLLSNALKFTLQGEIRLSAKLETNLDYGAKILKISVSDSGIGISDENKTKLFKAFEKIELGDKKSLNAQGVGLGLVISNNLVLMLGPPEQNNGMKVESEINKGTTFSFWIIEQILNPEGNLIFKKSGDMNSQMEEYIQPTERLDTAQNLFVKRSSYSVNQLQERIPFITFNSEISNVVSGLITRQPQILVVDDDIFNISAMEMILNKLGYACDTAYNGVQAIQKVKDRSQTQESPYGGGQYKLIFMDCNMPVMDGFEASKILKKKIKDDELEPIGIIACTAFLNEKEKARAYELEMDGYCVKPLNKDKVSDFVKKYVQFKN